MSSRFVLVAGLVCCVAGCSQKVPTPALPAAVSTVPEEAVKAFNGQDFDRAAAILATVLESDPNSRNVLFFYIRATQQQGLKANEVARWGILASSAKAARRLRDTFRPLTSDEGRLIVQALYNDACSLAQTGHYDEAMSVLGEAVDAGWSDAAHLAADADLASIRKRPEFAQLVRDASLRGAARLLARNHPFPFGFRLSDGHGKQVSLEDFKGKVVIVNFWASWSPPCRRQAPFLAEVDHKYREKGLEILGLNDERDEAAAASFLAEFPSPYPQLQADDATKKELPRWDGYPTTLLIDREGRVRLVVEGFGPAEASAMEQAVTILLGEK